MRPKKVILCVDHNEQELSARVFLLEVRGYRVLRAETSQEALEILERTVPGTLDLLMTELQMPGLSGNDLVRQAKQMHPMLPCLITSATVISYDRALAADAFMSKGAGGASELLDKVRMMVARKRGPKKHYPVPSYALAGIASAAVELVKAQRDRPEACA